MAQATELNTSVPMPSKALVQLKMQGLLCASVYAASFGVAHSKAALAFFDTKNIAIFLLGLVLVPLLVGYPLALLRRMMGREEGVESDAIAFLPYIYFASYGLASILVWIATREAHQIIFA